MAVLWGMAAQVLSGIVKDLNKKSAKSGIKVLLLAGAGSAKALRSVGDVAYEDRLYQWEAYYSLRWFFLWGHCCWCGWRVDLLHVIFDRGLILKQ
jgi:hypothetical protein